MKEMLPKFEISSSPAGSEAKKSPQPDKGKAQRNGGGNHLPEFPDSLLQAPEFSDTCEYMSGKSGRETTAPNGLIAYLPVPRLPPPGFEGRYRDRLRLPTALNELIVGYSEKSPSTMGTLERYDGLQSLVYEVRTGP